MLATEGMTLAMETGMHQYFEVAASYDYNVTQCLSEVIQTLYESTEPMKRIDDNISVDSAFTEYPDVETNLEISF